MISISKTKKVIARIKKRMLNRFLAVPIGFIPDSYTDPFTSPDRFGPRRPDAMILTTPKPTAMRIMSKTGR